MKRSTNSTSRMINIDTFLLHCGVSPTISRKSGAKTQLLRLITPLGSMHAARKSLYSRQWSVLHLNQCIVYTFHVSLMEISRWWISENQIQCKNASHLSSHNVRTVAPHSNTAVALKIRNLFCVYERMEKEKTNFELRECKAICAFSVTSSIRTTTAATSIK